MARAFHSVILPLAELTEFGTSAIQGRSTDLWRKLDLARPVFILGPPFGDLALNVVDWLASEKNRPLALRLKEADWPRGASSSLAKAGITVVACLSPDDGRDLLKAMESGRLDERELALILDAYQPGPESLLQSVSEVAAYFRQVAEAVAATEGEYLFIVSYGTE